MVIKQMKDDILAAVSNAIDQLVVEAKANGIVDVKEVDIKIAATYPLGGSDGTIELTKSFNVKPRP